MKRTRVTALTLAGILFSVCFGLATGVGGYTFYYAKGASYLGNDPATCANCHVMREQFNGWVKSSHHGVATCNDCHTPPGLIPKVVTKARNGFWHSFAFTTGRFPEPIRIGDFNRRVAETSCRKCHQDVVTGIEGPHRAGGEVSCLRCHGSPGH